MYYEINVSLYGHHFMATAERSITSPHELKAKLKIIRDKFPESEGFKLTVTRWEQRGCGMDIEEILGEP